MKLKSIRSSAKVVAVGSAGDFVAFSLSSSPHLFSSPEHCQASPPPVSQNGRQCFKLPIPPIIEITLKLPNCVKTTSVKNNAAVEPITGPSVAK